MNNMNRAKYIISLFINEEEYPVDQDPYFFDPRQAGNSGAPRPPSPNMPRGGVGGIPARHPDTIERRYNQNTFPWGSEIPSSRSQLHVYGGDVNGGWGSPQTSSGIGGMTY
jgi:hypothetical protein